MMPLLTEAAVAPATAGAAGAGTADEAAADWPAAKAVSREAGSIWKLTLRRLSCSGNGSGGRENGSFFFGGEGGDLLGS